MTIVRLILLPAIASLAACATAPTSPTQTAPLIDASGASIGEVSIRTDPTGTHLDLRATGLSPGPHGVHVHMVGRCDGPGFTTAGGHWNPTTKLHGHRNPGGFHAGDLGNLTAGADGTARAMLHLPAGSDVADQDGAALVIHARADDEATDPSGNSGDRIACAVIAPPR
ncbi:superoxide dismutase family protein [Sphingomonas sp.]|uniref:superoxide dismutase family protein n=1 Tax=Sphingomonas sp. TaxID=28214 RepID=UPI00286CB3E3|nr:superoxide dismutase family protein [Sphingomonas sp.]